MFFQFTGSILAAGALVCATAWSAAASEATGVFDVSIGKACWVEGYTNTGADWTVTIENGDTTAAVLRGSGVDFAKMEVIEGSARFDVAGGVRATFQAVFGGNAMNTRVKFTNGIIAGDGGEPAVFHTIVGGEDGGDDDWQDMLMNVTCLHHAG